MLSKEKFVKYVKRIQTLMDKDDKINDFCNEMFFDSNINLYFDEVNLVVDLLSDAMDLPTNTRDEGNDLEYFIFQLDFGKVPYSKNAVQLADGTEVSLTSAEELYDFIISQKNN